MAKADGGQDQPGGNTKTADQAPAEEKGYLPDKTGSSGIRIEEIVNQGENPQIAKRRPFIFPKRTAQIYPNSPINVELDKASSDTPNSPFKVPEAVASVDPTPLPSTMDQPGQRDSQQGDKVAREPTIFRETNTLAPVNPAPIPAWSPAPVPAKKIVEPGFLPPHESVPLVGQGPIQPTGPSVMGHSEDYKCLTGEVQQWHKSWRLRYAGVDVEDRYGGSVALDGDEKLSQLKDGQRVRVTGQLANPQERFAPTFRVQSLQVLDR